MHHYAFQKREDFTHASIIKWWLWLGVFMVVMQVMIGGITRLTGSGLSITKWEITMGTIPPLNHADWEEAFDLYKETPQYHKINKGMTMHEFKFIYFWEYFHRLWARSLGFIFAIPFFYFLAKGMIKRRLMKDLLIIVGLGAVVGVFGWIMVASGLINRPWVNAYKLTLHLNLAFVVFAYLFWTTLKVTFPERLLLVDRKTKDWLNIFGILLIIQLILGGVVSGMKAGLFYPTWPLMNGAFIPAEMTDGSHWTLQNFKEYDSHMFAPAFFQFFHRNIGYILFLTGIFMVYNFLKRHAGASRVYLVPAVLFGLALCIQVLLGILTLINCRGEIPVLLGVLHQMGAILLISTVLYWNFRVSAS